MIITESKPFGMIQNELKKSDKIIIVSCNECAKLCGTGGEEGAKDMENKLKKAGFRVVDKVVFAPICDKDLDKKVLKQKKIEANTMIILACDAGIYNVKRLFKNQKVIGAVDSIGLGAFDESGNIKLIRRFESSPSE